MSLDNYQGYANYETWALCLHINNNQDLQMEVQELLVAGVRDGSSSPGRTLKDWYEDVYHNFWEEGLYQGSAYAHVRMMIREVGTYERIDWHEAAWSIMPEDVFNEEEGE